MKARRGSLLPKLYIAGVALVVGSALVAWGIARFNRSRVPREHGGFARFVAEGVADAPDAQVAVDRAYTDLHASVSVFDVDGTALATAGETFERPAPLADGEVREPERFTYEVGVSSGRVVVMHFRPPGSRGQLGVIFLGVLVLIGVAAFLARRWLSRPLVRLGDTAHAIANGDLTARTQLRSNDEIGEAGRAFDAMAERVEGLLRSHRELLAGVSHELRTPIARIRVALELAQEATETPGVRTELAGIEQDLAELEALVEDVLSAARIDLASGKSAELPMRRQHARISDVLLRAKSRFTERHPDRIVAISVEDEAERELDPVLLRRAIENILDNAHKYSPAEAPIRIALVDDGGRAVITIEDEGFGIAPVDKARLFTPFFRVDSPEVRASSGLGLGLALARRIVEAHEGTIDVESELGEGTTVRIRI
jgi:two-component system OmpR family sensor kinase